MVIHRIVGIASAISTICLRVASMIILGSKCVQRVQSVKCIQLLQAVRHTAAHCEKKQA